MVMKDDYCDEEQYHEGTAFCDFFSGQVMALRVEFGREMAKEMVRAEANYTMEQCIQYWNRYAQEEFKSSTVYKELIQHLQDNWYMFYPELSGTIPFDDEDWQLPDKVTIR